jgi:hypothetical protein
VTRWKNNASKRCPDQSNGNAVRWPHNPITHCEAGFVDDFYALLIAFALTSASQCGQFATFARVSVSHGQHIPNVS